MAATFALIGIAIAGRAVWLYLRTTNGGSGEAFNVARAIAMGKGLADAYQIGQGPTAHLLPISPAFGGLVYATFGVNSPASEFVLASYALACMGSTYLLLFQAFGRLGVPGYGRLGSLAFLAIAPTYWAQESVDFRLWEGGVAAFLSAFFLNRLLKIANSDSIEDGALVCLAGSLATLFFVNPPLGLAALASAGVFTLFALNLKQKLLFFGTSVMIVACFVVPWSARNLINLGEPILLRSNGGLELAIANHPAALTSQERGSVFKNRLIEIHPAQSRDAFKQMQEMGGEVAYSKFMGARAWAWMSANRVQTAKLMLRHIWQLFMPEPWQFGTFGTGRATRLRAALASIAGVLGLLGLAFGCSLSGRLWIYPSVMIGVLAGATCLFQPVPRYTYLVYPILTYAAGFAVLSLAKLSARLIKRRSLSLQRNA